LVNNRLPFAKGRGLLINSSGITSQLVFVSGLNRQTSLSMSLTNYYLFVGRYVRGLMAPDANHFEVKLNTGNEFYRIAVNVRSQVGSMLMALVNDN
jgi:hypothetical protein